MSERRYSDDEILSLALATAARLGKPVVKLRQEEWPVGTISLATAVRRFGWRNLKRRAAERP